eukprot:1351949-Amorphochlora_amoeboformis.AAC.1
MQVCREIGLTDWGSLKTKRNRDHLGAGESLGTHQREESESSSLVKAHGIERYYYSLTGGCVLFSGGTARFRDRFGG